VTSVKAQKTDCAQLYPLKKSCFAISAWLVIIIHLHIFVLSGEKSALCLRELADRLTVHCFQVHFIR
jgi:hypothetical protein